MKTETEIIGRVPCAWLEMRFTDEQLADAAWLYHVAHSPTDAPRRFREELFAKYCKRDVLDAARRLLLKIAVDYGHPWPNEDFGTKFHREKIAEELQNLSRTLSDA